MRHAIESGEKIFHELRLENTEFIVNEVCMFLLKNSVLIWFNYTYGCDYTAVCNSVSMAEPFLSFLISIFIVT